MSKTVPDEPTEAMKLEGSLAIQEHYRREGGWCGMVAAREQAIITWQAMLAAAPAQTEQVGQSRVIHYPECWDTAAYPTLESALAELFHQFRCTNDDCAHADRAERRTTEGYWWCPNCKEEIGAYHVTYQEKHESCGHPVEWIEPAALADPVLRGEIENAALERAAMVCDKEFTRDDLTGDYRYGAGMCAAAIRALKEE